MYNFPALSGANNLGSILQFWFIPVGDIALMADPVDNIINEIDLISDPQKYWLTGYMTLESMSYSEPKTEGDQGPLYNASFSGFTPKDNPAIAAIMDEMVNDRFIIMIKDGNGYFKTVGDLESPLLFERSLSTTDKLSGLNGYNISFTGQLCHEAYFFTGTMDVLDSDTVISSLGVTFDYTSGSDPVTNFPQIIGDNLGSCRRFFFWPVEDTLSIPDAIENIRSGAITLKNGKTILEGYMTVDTMSYSEPKTETDHGPIFNPLLSGFCPKNTPEMDNVMHGMMNDMFMAMYEDGNGYFKIIGDVDQPLTFLRSMETTDKLSGRNGYQVSFSGQCDHEAYFYTGTFPASSILAPPVILDPPQATGPPMTDVQITAAQLTGFGDINTGYVTYTDTILQAFGKLDYIVKQLDANKEDAISHGTTLQYWRGDKTWQTLNTDAVPEGSSNLYFNNARARSAVSVVSPLSYNSSTGVLGTVYTPENVTNKGVANGYASLDSSGYVPLSEINPGLIGGLDYQGTWNASTNSPALASGTGTKGYYYKVSVAGTTTIDTISSWNVGDWIVFDGTVWDKVDNNEQVSSVVGQTGAVTIAQIVTALNLALNPSSGAFALSSSGVLTFPDASSSVRGLLNSSDWTTFNNKNVLSTAQVGFGVAGVLGGDSSLTYSTSTGLATTKPYSNSSGGITSQSAINLTALPFNGTGSLPLFMIQPSAITAATWGTAGTGIGINFGSGGHQIYQDMRSGGATVFSFTENGAGAIKIASGNITWNMGVGTSLGFNGFFNTSIAFSTPVQFNFSGAPGSPTNYYYQVNPTIAYSSGTLNTAAHSAIIINPVFNISGNSTGTMRALYINPTITALVNPLTAIETTWGKIVFTTPHNNATFTNSLSGHGVIISAATINDSASTGTIASCVGHSFDAVNLTGLSGLTATDVYNVYIAAPTVTTMTGTNKWALGVGGNFKIDGVRVNIKNLPTSSAGLATGDVWNNSGVLNII